MDLLANKTRTKPSNMPGSLVTYSLLLMLVELPSPYPSQLASAASNHVI
jgi:hypothetical protein